MKGFHSPLKSVRQNINASLRSPDVYICTPIDSIYLKEATFISPIAKDPNKREMIYSRNCFSAVKRSHRKTSSEDFSRYTSPLVKSNLQNKEFLIKDSLNSLKMTKSKKMNKFDIRFSTKKIEKKRDLRFKAINNLLIACSKVESSKKLNKNLAKEEKILNSWVKTVDKVTENLQKINDCNADIVHHLYYYNKFSNDEICKDINLIKMKTALPSA